MRVLVAYATKEGGTRGLAEMLGIALQDEGFEVEVADAPSVGSVEGYDAVIVGGALYTLRWHKDARQFVKRHRRSLTGLPVWLFSSGPLDDRALRDEIPPVRWVQKAMLDLGARGHLTFGGRNLKKQGSLPIGDWRDPDQVTDWGKRIAEELRTGELP